MAQARFGIGGVQKVNRSQLINMGAFVTVRRLPRGPWRRARQAGTCVELMDGSMALRGDWIVEPVVPVGDTSDLELVCEREFDEGWEIVRGATVC